jgi:predicted PurR-regulated permease PerM
VPFWLFYILHDETKVARGILKLLPERYRGDALNMARIVDSILGAYIRGQLLLCVFIGIMATAGLTLLGVQYAAVLGLMAGIFEILPFVGPIFGMAPAVLVAAVQSPWLGLWTLVLFIGIQQIENLFLVPRISGKAVELHPALIMVVLVIGNEVAGLWGMLVAVPLTAIVRDLFRYLYLRFQDEPVEPRDAMLKLRGSNNITPAA